MKVLGSERARERIGQGAKVPGSELARVILADSLRGANWPGSETAVNLKSDGIQPPRICKPLYGPSQGDQTGN